MNNSDAPDPHNDSVEPAASPLDKLTRAQVFARDPEQLTQAHIEYAIEEIRKLNERFRKAREDDAAITAAVTKLKKTNAAARKKKAAPVPAPDIMDTKL